MWLDGNYEFKLGFTAWKKMIQISQQIHECVTLWNHSGDWWQFESSSMTATFFNCQQNIILEEVFEANPSVGYFFLRTPFDRYGMFLRSFLRRKPHFGHCFSVTIVLWFLYFLCLQQSEGDLWEVPVGSSQTCKCKKILGLCQRYFGFVAWLDAVLPTGTELWP